MKVKSKKTGKIFEAVKIGDNTYQVDGKEVPKEKMSELFDIVKEQPKQSQSANSSKQNDIVVVSGDYDMGGDIGGLAEALAKCQGEFTAVKKNTSGHGYDYADIQAVLSSSMPITSKHGIAITQMNTSKVIGDALLVGVKTIIMHSSGGYISSEVFTPVTKTKMNSLVQMAGVNITYLRRYGLQSALGLATTDNDGRDD